MSVVADELVRGVADRLRTLLRSLDRRDRLETATEFVGWLEQEREASRLAGDAQEMLLRALRTACDPTNYRILGELEPEATLEPAELMRRTGLGRVALTERLNDLVQTGLAARDLVLDQVRGTELSSGFLKLVADVSRRVGEQLEEELEPGGEGAG